MGMTTRYSLTVGFRKDHGLQEKNSSQPKALLLSCQKNKEKLSVVRRMTILHSMNQKPPVVLDILKFLSLSLYLQLTIENISSGYCSFVLQHEPSEGNASPHHKQGDEASVIFFFYSRHVRHQTKNPQIFLTLISALSL